MYGLVHNNQIQVGPRQWNYMFFKDYLDEAGLDSTALPRVEPNQPVVGTNWKILPVTKVDTPQLKNVIEQLAGPVWMINANDITGAYTSVPENINIAKMKVKNSITANRYNLENAGMTYNLNGEDIKVSTARLERLLFQQIHQLTPDGETITLKLPGGVFKTVTKEELNSINVAVNSYVQQLFSWEASKHEEIEACVLAQLENFDTRHPSQVEG